MGCPRGVGRPAQDVEGPAANVDQDGVPAGVAGLGEHGQRSGDRGGSHTARGAVHDDRRGPAG